MYGEASSRVYFYFNYKNHDVTARNKIYIYRVTNIYFRSRFIYVYKTGTFSLKIEYKDYSLYAFVTFFY